MSSAKRAPLRLPLLALAATAALLWLSGELDRAEPAEPAGQTRDLAVMPERRIDERGRADEGAHGSRYEAERCCWRKASIGSSAPRWSTCQKVQPLHDGASCRVAGPFDRLRTALIRASSSRGLNGLVT